METWNLRNTSLTTFAAAPASGVVLTTVLCPQSTELRGKAVDSGANSDHIVGAETLHDLADCLEELDFGADQEIKVDRQIHKRFIFGNGESSAKLGLSHVNAGICGKEVTIQSHLVEGNCCPRSSSTTWM